MFPSLSESNTTDIVFRSIESQGQFFVGQRVFLQKFSDGDNVKCFQSRKLSVSSFIRTILGIIFRRSEPKMPRVNAVSCVTRMKNEFIFWNHTLMQFVGKSMRSHSFSADCKTSIPKHFSADPKPTIRNFGYVFPKALLDRFRSMRIKVGPKRYISSVSSVVKTAKTFGIKFKHAFSYFADFHAGIIPN